MIGSLPMSLAGVSAGRIDGMRHGELVEELGVGRHQIDGDGVRRLVGRRRRRPSVQVAGVFRQASAPTMPL